MNKYTEYCKNNWQILAAAQWLWFERKGLGVLHIKGDHILFGVYDDLEKPLQELCNRRLPQKYVLVKFEDGFVTAFQPSKSPQECFEMMKPQLGDFIADASEGIEI